MGCAIGPAESSMTVCTMGNIDNMYEEEVFINNHVDIIIDYHVAPEFEVRLPESSFSQPRLMTPPYAGCPHCGGAGQAALHPP